MSTIQRDIIVREVGLRDGLQIHPTFMPTADKLAWIKNEALSGVPEIEVTSFVPPKLIPQFADATEVCAGALQLKDLVVSALIPNLKGAHRGLELGVNKLNYVVSVSKTHNLKNVRRERDASMADFKAIVDLIKSLPEDQRPLIGAGLSTALGCSYEGKVALTEVVLCAEQLLDAGADEIVVCDTVGYADPALVRAVLKAVLAVAGDVPVAAHFHDTRGTGLANVTAALECGIKYFDASLGGLGGCPFAPGASGNIVMEDLCFMLDSMGLKTGVNLDLLLKTRQTMSESLSDLKLHGALARAGLPHGFVSNWSAVAA